MPAMAELRSEQPSNVQQISPLRQQNSADVAWPRLEPGANDAQDGPLAQLDWAAELRAAPGMEAVLGAGALLSPDAVVPPDNLFRTFLAYGLFRDLAYLYDRPGQAVHTLIALGSSVCGHPGLVHGGISATICDETLGALAYMLKRDGALPAGPAFTARLEVDYKKPLPAGSEVCCTARLISVEGRKIWASVQLADKPDGTVFAAGKALFVTARQPAAQAQDGKAPSESAADGHTA